MQEHSLNKEEFSDLFQYRKNYENHLWEGSGEIKCYKQINLYLFKIIYKILL